MRGTKSCGCREHWRTSENAQDEILRNSKLHRDKNDVGPSASFPVGYFEGGEMILPQLRTKFRWVKATLFIKYAYSWNLSYRPGCVCLFYSSILYHKVSAFKPLPRTVVQRKESITPGWIGSIFFFHKDSFEKLKGKPKEWGRQTNFGRNEGL